MKTILSIQSHVAAGYVGNRAAVFPLQLMGIEVIAVNTVQFSNHTGYGSWRGMVFDDAHIADLMAGLWEHGALDKIDGVLSGYLGDAGLGAIILDTVERARQTNPGLVYCCDPVMGDTGRGFFVRPEIPPFFREEALQYASILTPNQFELTALTGQEITNRAAAQTACAQLHQKGPEKILLTSLETPETPADQIEMLLSLKNGRQWLIRTPKLDLSPAPNGAGDLTASLFTGHIIAGHTPAHSLALTASSVFAVFEETARLGQRELALIAAQQHIQSPEVCFSAEKIN